MLLALDHARHVLQLLSASLVLLLDLLPTLLEFVLLSVVMASSLVMKLVILETASLQDAKTVKFNKDTLALDNHQSVKLPDLLHLHLLPLLHPHLHPLLLLPQQPNQLSINLERLMSTQIMSSSP